MRRKPHNRRVILRSRNNLFRSTIDQPESIVRLPRDWPLFHRQIPGSHFHSISLRVAIELDAALLEFIDCGWLGGDQVFRLELHRVQQVYDLSELSKIVEGWSQEHQQINVTDRISLVSRCGAIEHQALESKAIVSFQDGFTLSCYIF